MFIAHLIEIDSVDCTSAICNSTVLKLEATTYDEALKELHFQIIGKWDEEEECFETKEGYDFDELEKIILYDVKKIKEIPVKNWYVKAEALEAEKLKEGKENEERRLYEKLKRKFESK